MLRTYRLLYCTRVLSDLASSASALRLSAGSVVPFFCPWCATLLARDLCAGTVQMDWSAHARVHDRVILVSSSASPAPPRFRLASLALRRGSSHFAIYPGLRLIYSSQLGFEVYVVIHGARAQVFSTFVCQCRFSVPPLPAVRRLLRRPLLSWSPSWAARPPSKRR